MKRTRGQEAMTNLIKPAKFTLEFISVKRVLPAMAAPTSNQQLLNSYGQAFCIPAMCCVCYLHPCPKFARGLMQQNTHQNLLLVARGIFMMLCARCIGPDLRLRAGGAGDRQSILAAMCLQKYCLEVKPRPQKELQFVSEFCLPRRAAQHAGIS